MKEKLLKLFNAKQDRKQDLLKRSQEVTEVQELRSINSEMEVINTEMVELRTMIDSMKDTDEEHFVQGGEKRSAQISSKDFNPIGTFNLGEKRSADIEDMEYRKAFMDYVLRGAAITRADSTTNTTDIGEVIPTTIVNKIVEKLNTYGYIFQRITKTNIKGGVAIPKSSAKPTATWVAEGNTADKQNKTTDGTVTFSYHKLQCRVAVTLEADTTSLAIFEQSVIDNIYEAMIIALEQSIISGTGTKQPLGIIKDTDIKSTQKIVVKANELQSWEKWSKIFAKIPLAKRQGVVLILNNETWEGDIMGMTDANGQPVARVNIGLNGEDKPIFKGKEVIPTDLYLPSFEAATTGEVFGILVNLKDYMLNSNLQMTMKRYFDEETDEWITKSTLIADGKLTDTQGVILLTKGANA
jgi:HK97 family phage major capsid protein